MGRPREAKQSFLTKEIVPLGLCDLSLECSPAPAYGGLRAMKNLL